MAVLYSLKIHTRAQKAFEKAIKSGHPGIKQALKTLSERPELGKPLRDNLQRFKKLRKDPYRIVYEIDKETLTVRIIAIATRDTVYDDINDEEIL
jgi:mRNA-degrading endonuclease RelE of RelBE toxin-antitoxin system